MTLCYEMDGKHEMIRKAVREFAESEIKPVAGDLEDNEELHYKYLVTHFRKHLTPFK